MMHSDGKGCPMELGAVADTDCCPPPGFHHFLGTPTCRFRWQGRDPRHDAEARTALTRHMDALATAMANATEPAKKPALPAGYTYALQLVAHDLVDTAKPFWAVPPGPGTKNQRSRRLWLDTLYGDGPDVYPAAYGPDPGSDNAPIAFRLGPVKAVSGGHAPSPCGRDIPRHGLLADKRNDQHVLLSQTLVVFMALHNAILAALPQMPPSGNAAERAAMVAARFGCAREATTLIYRAVLRHDILGRILHPAVRDMYLAGQPLFGCMPPSLPLEFSHGAFRFGHAMVRGNYQFNARPELRTIEEILALNSTRSGHAFPFDASWIVDWAQFLDFGRGAPANHARPIGGIAQGRLLGQHLSNSTGVRPPGRILATRDLMSAALGGLWSVWKLADAVAKRTENSSLPQLLSDIRTNWPWLLDTWNGGVKEGFVLGAETMQALAEDPPFPFFVLLEAAASDSHTGLGPLGSVIVAETIVGAMAAAPLPAEREGASPCEQLRAIGAQHGFEQALCDLPTIQTLPAILEFLAKAPPWTTATPPLFSRPKP